MSVILVYPLMTKLITGDLRDDWLNPFLPDFLFWPLHPQWKYQKTFGFVRFSGRSKGDIGRAGLSNLVCKYIFKFHVNIVEPHSCFSVDHSLATGNVLTCIVYLIWHIFYLSQSASLTVKSQLPYEVRSWNLDQW